MNAAIPVGERIGRAKKVLAFARALDATIRARGNNPREPEAAAKMAELVEALTPTQWTAITAQLNHSLGRQYEAPSDKSKAVLVALCRMRAGMQVEDFDSQECALHVDRELAREERGEPDSATQAMADRYVALLDEKTHAKGNDPKAPDIAAKIVAELGKHIQGPRWYYLSRELGERYTPSVEVVRVVLNEYRCRAGQPEDAAPQPTPLRFCTCGEIALPGSAVCGNGCVDPQDAEVLHELMDPARRAEQLRNMNADDAELRRRRRSGGRR